LRSSSALADLLAGCAPPPAAKAATKENKAPRPRCAAAPRYAPLPLAGAPPPPPPAPKPKPPPAPAPAAPETPLAQRFVCVEHLVFGPPPNLPPKPAPEEPEPDEGAFTPVAASTPVAAEPAPEPDPVAGATERGGSESLSDFAALSLSDWSQAGSQSPAAMHASPDAAAAAAEHARRCAADNAAALASAPPHLALTLHGCARQVEAFEFADRCNGTLPRLGPPTIEVSRLAAQMEAEAAARAAAARAAPPPAPPGGATATAAPPAPPATPAGYHSPFLLDHEARERAAAEARRASAAAAHAPAREALRAALRRPPPAAAAQPPLPSSLLAAPPAAADAPAAEAAAEPPEPAPPPPPPRREEAVFAFCVERFSARAGAHFRSFVAASHAAAWREHLAAPPGSLHWYEVVREGRPCHLYLDLECPAAANPGLDLDAAVDALLAHAAAAIADHFPGRALDYGSVYELESSTPEKLSRHLVVRLPGAAWATNLEAGAFVAALLARPGAAAALATLPAGGCLVDTAVYTRNRHFRCVYSSKGGRAAALRPTARFAGAARPSPARAFLETLVCRVDPAATLLAMRPPGAAGTGAGPAASAVPGAFVAAPGAPGGRRVAWKNGGGADAPRGARLAARMALAERALPFIESVATRAGGAEARARTLAFCGDGGTVAYSMVGPGSHHCARRGGPHASNHVYYVVALEAAAYAQKCHDPECAGFRAPWAPLPEGLRLPPWRLEEEEEGGEAAA
jgi:hypothetical protein